MAHSLLTPADPHGFVPEGLSDGAAALYEACRQAPGPVAVAELAARQQLGTAVVAVLAADLIRCGLLQLHCQAPHTPMTLERVLHGLRHL